MKERDAVIVLVLLFILTRAAGLVADPFEVGFCETFKAMAAYDLMTARNFSVFDYAVRFNEGGSVVVVFLAAAFFKLMGVSVLVLRLVPLLFSFSSFCLGYGLLRRFFGFLPAVLFGVFFIFLPQTYVCLSMVAWGTHVEAVVFSFMVMYCLCKLVSEDPAVKNGRIPYACLLGFVGGLSVWFGYMNLIAVAAALACMAVFHRSFRDVRIVMAMACSMVVGLVPAIIFYVYSQGASWSIYSTAMLDHFPVPLPMVVMRKAWSLFTQDLPLSFFSCFLSPPVRWVLCAAYYLAVIVAGVHAAFLMRMRKPGFTDAQRCIIVYCLAYLAVFFAAYSFSDFSVDHANLYQGKGYRYVASIFPLLSVLLAISASHLRFVAGRIALLVFAVIPCCWGMMVIVKPSYLFVNAWGNPVSYQSFGWSIALKYGHDFRKCLSYADRIDAAKRRFFFWGMAEGALERFTDDADRFFEDCKTIPEAYRPSFYMGLGANALNKDRDIKKAFSGMARVDQRYRRFVYAGVGAYAQAHANARKADFLLLTPAEYRGAFFEGVGAATVYVSGNDLKVSIRAVAQDRQIPLEFRANAFRGMSLAVIADEFSDSQEFLSSMTHYASTVPAAWRRDFIEGIEDVQKVLGNWRV